MLFFAALTAVAGAVTPSPTNYSGYLVDLYCLGLNRAGGLAKDGTDVTRDPSQHTLHCLRDPRQCREGGYYLAARNPDTQQYDVKFKLDDEGNQAALALLDSYPFGHPRDNQPGKFTVTVVGMADSSTGLLRNVTMTECFPSGSPQCDSVCRSTGSGCDSGNASFTLTAPALLWGHVVCMLLSWGCLLPLGILWARNLRLSRRMLGSTPMWFAGHRILQSVGWFFQLLGFVLVIILKGGSAGLHFSSPHEILGLVVVVVGSLQPLNAQLRHLSCIGHPEEGSAKQSARLAWEFAHKGLGYGAVVCGAINVILGIVYASDIGFGGALVIFSSIVVALSLGFQLIAGLSFECLRCLRADSAIGKIDASRELA